MLYSIVVNFKSENEATIPSTRGYHAYALFLNLLRQAHPEMSEKLHDLDGPKPFTISPLQGRFQRRGNGIELARDGIYWIRLTFLQEDAFAHFLDAALRSGDRTLRLDQALLHIHEVRTTPGSSPMCECHTFEDILSAASACHEIHLGFLSPTAFRSGGKRNVLFPEPRLAFNGYLAKWQSFSPVKLNDGLLALAEKGVRISQYKLETRILHFGSYQEIGFEGKCTFEIAENMPEEEVKSLNALADFSFYCGTGAKTTMGMGQTRRAGNGRSVSRGTRGDATEG